MSAQNVASVKGWAIASVAACVAVILAPFWFIGFVCGALWWALRDGFMEAKK